MGAAPMLPHGSEPSRIPGITSTPRNLMAPAPGVRTAESSLSISNLDPSQGMPCFSGYSMTSMRFFRENCDPPFVPLSSLFSVRYALMGFTTLPIAAGNFDTDKYGEFIWK
jgi:hypothetical protein